MKYLHAFCYDNQDAWMFFFAGLAAGIFISVTVQVVYTNLIVWLSDHQDD
jgi:hypothetical protein